MPPSRAEKVKQIVAGALELDPAQRPAYVERACGGDAELRQDVETLLNAGDPDSFAPDMDDPLPAHIGHYRIMREIGSGGIGTVYLGERVGEGSGGEFGQRVIVKMIRRGVDASAVRRRFFDEKRSLTRLRHPNIASLLDGGMFERRPYFVMEHVEGEPILEYANRLQLSIASRIRLFLPVCDAVEHAHGRLILHRYIRAGSILVDSSGTPKLLDFGIAGLIMGNEAEPPATATDVYGLGMALFELLAGEGPHGVTGDEPLPWPSELADGPTARILKGDLDDIVLKAISREPEDRYQRAADVAADLNRYLKGLPVQARSGGRLYRMRKFVARNRRSLAVAAVAVLAIGLAGGDAIIQGRRAQRHFDDLRQLTGSFLFEFHDAIANLPGSTPARELVLRRALQYLDSLARDSANDAGLKRELGESYIRVGDAQGLDYEANRGKPVEARASYLKAVVLLSDAARAAPSDMRAQSDLARARNQLASAMSATGEAEKAWRMLEEQASSLEALDRKQGLSADAKLNLGRTYFGIAELRRDANYANESLQSRLHSIDLFRNLARDANNREALRWYATSEMRLASFYLLQLHDAAKSGESLNVAIDIDRRRVSQNSGDAAARLDLTLAQSYLGAILQRKGDLAGAQRLYEATMSVRKELLAADPNNYRLRYLLVTDYVHLGDLLRLKRDAAAARAVYREGMAIAMPLQPRADADPDAARSIAELKKRSME